jgi:hypothetical protein
MSNIASVAQIGYNRINGLRSFQLTLNSLIGPLARADVAFNSRFQLKR